jgi:hypothetical protein
MLQIKSSPLVPDNCIPRVPWCLDNLRQLKIYFKISTPTNLKFSKCKWDEKWQEKPKYLEKTCPSVILSTTNLT